MKNRFTKYITGFSFLLIANLIPEFLLAKPLAIPKPPLTLVAVANSPSQITLTWQDASADETGFEVERSTDGKTFVKIISLPVNSATYANVGLTASTLYYFRVRAANASGFSGYSNIATATTRPPVITIPKAPSGLTATAISGLQINLTWDDNAADETGFELERSLDGITFVKISDFPSNTESFENAGLTPVTKYWYRILAKNTAGKSTYSNVVTATTLPVIPATPDDLAGVAISPTQINLSWTDKSDNENGFQLERSSDGTTFSKVADLAANVIVYQNTGLTPATEYYYRIRAINAVGGSPYSAIIATKTQNIPVPDKPVSFTAVPIAPELVQLRWSRLSANATETVIERSKDSDENFVQIGKVPANIIQFEDKGKLETADYYYRIKAINAGGSSPYSLISIVRASSIITAVEPNRADNLIFVFEKTLVTELKSQTAATLSVYDIKGVQRRQLDIPASSRTDLHTLSPGIYVVVVRTSREVISRKILLY